MRIIQIALISAALVWVLPAHAYVDRSPTLGRIAREASEVALVEVQKFNRENGALVLKKIKDFHGLTPDTLRQQVIRPQGSAIPRHILQWALPNNQAVVFSTPSATLVCLGPNWYQLTPSSDGWWRLGADRGELPLAYSGSISRLSQAMQDIFAGREATITVLRHGIEVDAADFDTALNRTSLPGLRPLDRIRASLQMPPTIMAVTRVNTAANAWYVGPGAAGDDDIPALVQRLNQPDAQTRADAADDLRSLDRLPPLAAQVLTKLLDDSAPMARCAAAAALLHSDLHPLNAPALKLLDQGLQDSDPLVRRYAARAAGVSGPVAGAILATHLAALLADANDVVRATALEAIAVQGPSAAPAMDALAKLLDDPTFGCDAADALGRIGPAARSLLPLLIPKLSSAEKSMPWAAARAMVQIGGSGADPVIDYLIRQLESANDVDAYNIMICFAVLGEDAKRALPDLARLEVRDRLRYPWVVWSIEPEKQFPWEIGVNRNNARPASNDNVRRWNFEAFVRQLGDRARPSARILAQRIIEGTVTVPGWGYQLLVDFPDEALPAFIAALDDAARRPRVLIALSNMGKTAATALPILRAMQGKADAATEELLANCIRQIDL